MTTKQKSSIKIPTIEQQENIRNTRKTLKVLQQVAKGPTGKENLVGRPRIEKDSKIGDFEKNEAKRKKMSHKSVQTGESVITEADLTSDEPSADYWKVLAEKRGDALNDSFKENEKLKGQVDDLQEENKICKEMLEEARTLVDVLQEIVNDNDTSTEVAQEATEDAD